MRYIITYFPGFKKNAFKEAEKAGAKVLKELDKNVSIIEISNDTGFNRRLIEQAPVFIRHIMPVGFSGEISGERLTDCQNMLDAAIDICKMDIGMGFSVQCRILNLDSRVNIDYSSRDVEVFIGKHFDRLGCVPVFSTSEIFGSGDDLFVISVFIRNDLFYLGFSKASENLNAHSDEYRILSKQGREISRAENKLKEAIAKFNIKIGGEGYALDIGASPGGWTKVLADYGFSVAAVDPGDLNESLHGNPKITHIRDRIENVNFDHEFEIIVNDMNIDPCDTAQITVSLAPKLKDGGLAVVTLKLPFSDIERSINESVEILKKAYEVLAIKNLSHNRREVTALLKKL